MKLKSLLLGIVIGSAAAISTASEVSSAQGSQEATGQYEQVHGRKMFEKPSSDFVNRAYDKQHHWRMPNGVTMNIDIAYTENPHNKEWGEATWYRFSMFSVEAVKAYDDFLRSASTGSVVHTEQEHCNTVDCGSTKDQTALVPLGGNQDRTALMALSQSQNVFTDISEYFKKDTSTGVGESVLQDLNESSDTPDFDDLPFGHGQTFQEGNPLAELGVTQLAELMKQIQKDNGAAGQIVLFVANIPQVGADSQIKLGKTVLSKILFQVCHADPYYEEMYGCTDVFDRSQKKPGLLLLSAQHHQAMSKMLKDSEKAGLLSLLAHYSGYDPKVKQFKVYDVFAYIGDQVKSKLEAFKFTMDEQFVDETVYVTTYVESDPNIERDEKGNALTYSSAFTNSGNQKKITMTVRSEGGHFARTTFTAEDYPDEIIALTPKSVLKEEALNAGYIDARAMFARVRDIARVFRAGSTKEATLMEQLVVLQTEMARLATMAGDAVKDGTCSHVELDWKKQTYRARCTHVEDYARADRATYLEADLSKCDLTKSGLILKKKENYNYYFLECRTPL